MSIAKIIMAFVISIVVFFLAAFILAQVSGFNQRVGGGYTGVNDLGLLISLGIAGFSFFIIVRK